MTNSLQNRLPIFFSDSYQDRSDRDTKGPHFLDLVGAVRMLVVVPVHSTELVVVTTTKDKEARVPSMIPMSVV
jgi:hypothetical protein